jgi:zinc protease
MRILVVERPALPLVSLTWASQTARDSGAPQERGLAALTARVLTQGTKLSDGRVLAHVRINGEAPRIWVGEDGTALSVHAPAAGVSVALDILAATVRRPIFTPPGIQIARADQLEAILWQSVRFDYELRDAALYGLFGVEHPPAGPFGTREDVLDFTPEALSSFYAAHYAPNDSALVAVGAVKLEEIVELAERDFGDWPRSAAPPAPMPAAIAPLAASKPIQGLSGSEDEARFTLALPCPPSGGAPEADFDLLGMVLANVPLSRATRLLRHDQGITYAVSARCDETRARGTFWVDFAVDPGFGGHALALVLDELQRLRTESVPVSELELAKIQLLGYAGNALSTNAGIAEMLADYFLRGEPPDVFAHWIENVKSATGARVRETAQRYLTGHVGVAVYGPPARIEPGLRQFPPPQWRTVPLRGDE